MQHIIGRLLVLSLLLAAASTYGQGQASARTDSLSPQQDLSEFEGLYRYRDGGRLVMVAGGGRLVALIGEAKYPLRAVATDTFTNPSGDELPFMRNSAGEVVGFKEHGEIFARLSTGVGAETRQLLVPRPPGPDGRPQRYRCTQPPELADGIRVAEMGPGTLPRNAAEIVVNGVLDGSYPDIRAIAVHHKGALVLEEYFYGYERARPHQMRSLTKSVISLLAGAAVDRGLLRADEPVVSRLGYASIASPDPRKGRITLTDLLSNQSGLACDDHDGASPGNEVKLYEAADWPKAFVDLPMLAEPGTTGRYCSFGFITAGRIIELAAGKPLAQFAQEVLFGPMDIARTQWRWTFVLDRSQRNEFGQIHLRPRDMLKLGLLIQQRGAWQARRIISESWIDATVAMQSRVDDSGYGLGIWHRWYGVPTAKGTQRVETIMLSGNGGQKVYIVPALELVVVFTGGSFNRESPANRIIARVLLPALLDAEAATARSAHH
ncbi:serine hydrolase [Pelomonas sp. V22]|uniref:serine hydrolase domain-containing protein n=1 Tax=Pelomonas sp. V22 TaxID=2822139 RepID=UPI0024A8DCEA|nr:serine hydrolase [Pelomonas sp. V22]MDI4635487.1 serine hydrolase [Pelomonas sp. V22]